MRPNEAHQPLDRTAAHTLRQIQQFSAAVFVWAVGLLALGSIVAATDATAGCSGWPLCNGQATPPSDTLGFVNVVHRLGGLLLILATGFLSLVSFLKLRSHRHLVRLTAGVFLLVLAQAVFGGYGVAFGFPAWATGAHLGVALLVVAALLTTIVLLQRAIAAPADSPSVSSGYAAIAAAGAITLFLTLVTAASSGFAEAPATCTDFSNCADNVIASTGSAGGLAGMPYMFGLFTVASIGSLLVAHRRAGETSGTPTKLGSTATGAIVAGVVASVLFASLELPNAAGAVPAMLMILAWLCLTAIVIQARAEPIGSVLANPRALAPDVPGRAIARDFLRVTKPGIMLLLLTTTLGGMLIAAGDWPGTGLVALTLLGGALASGGASALNCYFDRDIDRIMARTRQRPIPLGSLTAGQVRAFAVALSTLAVVILVTFVNPLAAALALGGNLFYIVVYTVWLKRSTPQNIVIGGAAGSFPPLVGWAAVTGSVSLTALLLAAIIFYWTPPHFWSLALLKANDYRRANIPMLPVTHGEQTTRRFILLYSLLLVAVTLLVVPVGPAGIIYLAVAALLGGWFVALAARMYYENTSRLAWRLFKFSNYYLALVLAALVIDRILIV